MNNEELLAKYKTLFPDNVEAIVVRKDDYDRLYGDLTKENIELKQEIERLNNIINELEKWLKEKNKFYEISTMGYSYGVTKEVIDKLQELKGSDKE